MTLLPLIPLLPLLGFLFNFLYGTRLSRPAHGQGGHGPAWEHSPLIGWVACGSMLLSFLCAVGAVPDPYQSGSDGFELVLDLVEQGCQALIADLRVRLGTS